MQEVIYYIIEERCNHNSHERRLNNMKKEVYDLIQRTDEFKHMVIDILHEIKYERSRDGEEVFKSKITEYTDYPAFNVYSDHADDMITVDEFSCMDDKNDHIDISTFETNLLISKNRSSDLSSISYLVRVEDIIDEAGVDISMILTLQYNDDHAIQILIPVVNINQYSEEDNFYTSFDRIRTAISTAVYSKYHHLDDEIIQAFYDNEQEVSMEDIIDKMSFLALLHYSASIVYHYDEEFTKEFMMIGKE
jgi:hypothetical protein